jgi:integrase/recombinase XerD
MSLPTLGQLVYSFFVDHLQVAKGLRPSSITSYRDGLRLFLRFVASDIHRRVTTLVLEDLTCERVLRFLRSLEDDRDNHVRTRNHRLAILRAFFDYLGGRVPECLAVAEQVTRIPTKRAPPPETHFLERNEVQELLAAPLSAARTAERDRTMLLFLYNTGARAQEVADLRVGQVELVPQPRVRLHGKGDKWRTCPLWTETAERLRRLLGPHAAQSGTDVPVFRSQRGAPLTRFGIYKIVRRHAACLDAVPGQPQRRVTPHVFRHTTAVHLLEAGVEVNVIRGWLGHVSLETTNRYAEINIRTKEAALRRCTAPTLGKGFPQKAPWRNDTSLMDWLDSL